MDLVHVRHIVDASAQNVLPLRPMMGSYVWLVDDQFHLPATGRAFVTFEAQATNDIHVSFNKDTSRVEGRDGLADQSPNYEVVIGGWMNRKTAVRKRGQQQAAARKEENPNAVITSPHFTQYWFLLDNGLLVVGKGEPGTHEIIRWKDDHHDFQDLRYVGFSSWDKPIQYRHIAVTGTIPVSCLSLSRLSAHSTFRQGESSLFLSDLFADVHFHVGSAVFPAHCCILSCRCPALLEQLLDASAPTEGPRTTPFIVTLAEEETRADEFRELLRFIYTGEVKLRTTDRESFDGLLALAQRWSPQLAAHLTAATAAAGGLVALPWFGELVGSERWHDVVLTFPGDSSSSSASSSASSSSSAAPPPPTGRLPAHRAILATASEPLWALLGGAHGWRERTEGEVALHDVDEAAFRILMECVYKRTCRRFTSLVEEVLPLLLAADRFDLLNTPKLYPPPAADSTSDVASPGEPVPLADHCLAYAMAHFDLSTCCPTFHIADVLALPALRLAAQHFIQDNFDRVCQTKKFLSLESHLLLELVVKDALVVSDEEHVWEAVLRWAAHNPDAESALAQILTYIRYPLISPSYVAEHILPHPYAKLPGVEEAVKLNSNPLKLSGGSAAVQAGKVVLRQSLADILNRPRTPRSLQGWKELPYSGTPGDASGLFHWLGTSGGAGGGAKERGWVNPCRAGLVKVVCSAPPSRYSNPEAVVDRAFHTTWYTSGRPHPWLIVQLLKEKAFVMKGYAIRQDGSTVFLRSWSMQGSNDGQSWVDLSTHVNDCGLASPSRWVFWPVSSVVPYAQFRLIMTGPSASPVSPNTLALSNIEFYGFFN